MHDTDDETLVGRAMKAPAGDLRAFEALVRRHQARVVANCRFLSGSAEDAEDLAQEVFVKAFFALPRFERRASFGTWIRRIKVNHCLNFLRGRKGRSFVDLDDPVREAEPALHVSPRAERRAIARDDRERIQLALAELPETLRVALVMRDLDEMAYQEIADALGIGLSAAKMRIKRGREEFRRVYTELAREPHV